MDFVDAYDENVWTVYGFIAYRVARRADAEDLTQQTFERALRAWHRFDPGRASAQTWLITIARNLLIDHYRAHRAEQPLERLEGAEPSEELNADLGLSPEIAAALQELSTRDREVVALRFGADMTGQEIATALDLSLANVQQILSRALRRMRARLEEAGAVRR
jgi:RNA polymerase sigma-70 factor, ECF subfamily